MIGSLAIGILITIIGLLIIVAIVLFKVCYVDVPQNSALIVDNRKVAFAGTIVLPHQPKQLISIAPVQVRTAYLGKNGLYSQDKLLMDVIISYSLCVERSTEAILKAVNLVGAQSITQTEAVGKALAETLKTTAQQIIQQYPYEVLDKDRGKLRKALAAHLINKLQGYELLFVNIDKIELMPLERLAKQDDSLAKAQQEIRFEWDKAQKQLLATRLKMVLSQQRELSEKIKKMIAEYQAVISKKIKFHLSRDFLH